MSARRNRAEELGRRLREERIARGMNQRELAQAVSEVTQGPVDQPRFSRIEKGRTLPSIPLLDEIAEALDPDDGLLAAKLMMDTEAAEVVTAHQRGGIMGVADWLARKLSGRR